MTILDGSKSNNNEGNMGKKTRCFELSNIGLYVENPHLSSLVIDHENLRIIMATTNAILAEQ